MLYENMYYFASNNTYTQNENYISDKIRLSAYPLNGEFDMNWPHFYKDSAYHLSDAMHTNGFDNFHENHVSKSGGDRQNLCKNIYGSCNSSQEYVQEYSAPIPSEQSTPTEFEIYKLCEYGGNIDSNERTETHNCLLEGKTTPEIPFESHSNDKAEYCRDEQINPINLKEINGGHQLSRQIYGTNFIESNRNGK